MTRIGNQFLDKCELSFASEFNPEKTMTELRERSPGMAWLGKFIYCSSGLSFIRWIMPDRSLAKTELYTTRLYLSSVLRALIFFYSIQAAPFAIFFVAVGVFLSVNVFLHPALLHHGKLQIILNALMREVLSSISAQEAIFLNVGIVAICILLNLPRALLWNRRTRRLRRLATVEDPALIERVPADSAVWPPEPIRLDEE